MPIDYKIERKNYDLIGSNIASILASEIKEQWNTYEVEDCKCVDVYKNRMTAIDATELSVINVSYASSDFSNKNQGTKSGDNTYYIDVYCNSKSNREEDGDEIAVARIERLMGIIDEILEHPMYKKLGFVPNGIISSSMVSNIEMVYPKPELDALSTVFGRVTFTVRANESTGLTSGVELDVAITKVYVNSTTKGFKYELTSE